MRKAYKSLRVGEKFYPPLDNDKMDLRFQMMKISTIVLTTPPPWGDGLNVTLNVMKGVEKDGETKYFFNAVIINSPPENRVDGYFDYLPDDLMVYPENLMC